ncbi:hypothetical protein WJT86_02680 [Microvirga sp. W0021]|uniref:Tail assembly chaperone n=1 Tax=Hohaiivirga grylli TaxID=3133970 RepID=A0ABV0BG52_9HYPH
MSYFENANSDEVIGDTPDTEPTYFINGPKGVKKNKRNGEIWELGGLDKNADTYKAEPINNPELKFEIYLNRALEEWPKLLKCSPLDVSPLGKHYISGLSWLEQDIIAPYYGTADELVMVTLHHAIMVAIHETAKTTPNVEPAKLDFLRIRNLVNEDLQYILNDKEECWKGDKYFEFIRNYLSINNRN